MSRRALIIRRHGIVNKCEIRAIVAFIAQARGRIEALGCAVFARLARVTVVHVSPAFSVTVTATGAGRCVDGTCQSQTKGGMSQSG